MNDIFGFYIGKKQRGGRKYLYGEDTERDNPKLMYAWIWKKDGWWGLKDSNNGYEHKVAINGNNSLIP